MRALLDKNGFEKTETGYKLSLDTLHEDELIFQLCETDNPEKTESRFNWAWLILLIADKGIWHSNACVQNLIQETVEGVEAATVGGVAIPHSGTNVLGNRGTEESGLGLFELSAREVFVVHIGARCNQLEDGREVVRGAITTLGLHSLQVHHFLELIGWRATLPAGAVQLFEHIVVASPEVQHGGGRHIVQHSDAQIFGAVARKHGAEKDGVEVGTGVGFKIFNQAHNLVFCFWG